MSSDLEALSIFPVDLFFFFFAFLANFLVMFLFLRKTSQMNLLGHYISLLNINQSWWFWLYHRGFLTTRLFTVTVFSNWPFSARAHVTYSYLKPKLGDTVCSNVKCGVCKQKTAAVLGCFLTISDSFSCTRKAIWYSVKSSNPKPENWKSKKQIASPQIFRRL